MKLFEGPFETAARTGPAPSTAMGRRLSSRNQVFVCLEQISPPATQPDNSLRSPSRAILPM